MKGRYIMGASAIATIIIGGSLASLASNDTPNNTKLIPCSWGADTGEILLYVQSNGYTECDQIFNVISPYGVNWQAIPQTAVKGNDECKVSENNEFIWVYEYPKNDAPLMTSGNDLCSRLESVGWMPS